MISNFLKSIFGTRNSRLLKEYAEYIKNINNLEFKLEIPEVNLTEPLSVLVDYIYKSIKNNTNKIFDNNLNINITKTLKKLS